MKQNVTLVLLGVLIGAVLMLAVPSQAHHRYSYDRLRYRVDVLEGKTSHIGYPDVVFDPAWIDLPSGCSGEPAVWDFTTHAGLGC